MALTKQNQRSANRVSVPVGATGGRTPPSKLTVALLTTSVLSAIWAAAMLTPAGRVAYAYVFVYSEFYFGVLALVFLSITVMAGVLATDRMILTVRQRVLLQSAHRTTAVISAASLVVHVMTKVAVGHVGVIDVIIPFTASNNGLFVGLGTLAAWFLFSTLWTGIARAAFIGKGRPWMWRSLHSLAYLSWPIALVHGLSAGRAAKTWVLVSYIACIALVLVTLIVRVSVAINRKKDFSSTSTGSLKPVGKLVSTAAAGVQSRSSRRERDVEVSAGPIAGRLVSDRRNAPARDPWEAPARRLSAETRSARSETREAPAVPEQRPADEAYRPARRPADGARGRRAAGDDRPREARDDYARDDYARDDYARDDYARDDYARDDYARDRNARDDRYDERGRDDRSRDDDARDDRGRDAGRPDGGRDDYARDERADSYPAARYDEEPARPRGRRRAAEDADRGYDDDEAPRRVGSRSSRYADDEPVRPRAEPDRFPERYDARTEARTEAPRPRRATENTGARSRWRSEEERPARGGRRRAEDDDDRIRSRSRRAVADDGGPRSRWRADEQDPYEVPQPRTTRYADDERVVGARDGARHSSGAAPFVWDAGTDATYLPPDDTPTLIDMASRRARRTAEPAARGAGRGARGGRSTGEADDMYSRRLRDEAQ